MPLKAGRNIWGNRDLDDILFGEEGTFLLKTYPSEWTGGKDDWKLRPEPASRSDILYLFGQGNQFYLDQGKVREFWKVMCMASACNFISMD